MKLLALFVAALLLTGCAGAFQPEYQINFTAAEVEGLGMGVTGRTDISAFEWMNIATRACNEGAWDWDVARQIFDEDIGRLGPNARAAEAQSVWLLVAGVCPELVPDEAIDSGPPPPGY